MKMRMKRLVQISSLRRMRHYQLWLMTWKWTPTLSWVITRRTRRSRSWVRSYAAVRRSRIRGAWALQRKGGRRKNKRNMSQWLLPKLKKSTSRFPRPCRKANRKLRRKRSCHLCPIPTVIRSLKIRSKYSGDKNNSKASILSAARRCSRTEPSTITSTRSQTNSKMKRAYLKTEDWMSQRLCMRPTTSS